MPSELRSLRSADSLPLLADRLAIQELTARYAFFMDTFQIDPLMGLFVDEDPVFDEERAGMGRHVGQEAIRAYFEGVLFPMFEGLIHLTGNHIIDENSDETAHGKCSAMVRGDIKGAGTVQATCWYQDHYRLTADGWKFASRVVTPYTKFDFSGLPTDG